MDADLQNSILKNIDTNQSWTQEFIVPHGSTLIDLSCAIGDNPSTPQNAPDQPAIFPIRNCYYKFESKFKTSKSWPDLERLLKECLPGASYAIARGQKKTARVLRYKIHCTHYRTINDYQPSPKTYQEGSYAQDGIKTETIKRQKSTKSFDRMASKSEKKVVQATTSSKQTSYSVNQPSNRRRSSGRALNSETRCNCAIQVILGVDDYFYLDAKNSSLFHQGHSFISPASTTIRSAEISDDCSAMILKMSSVGVKPSQITKFLDMFEESDRLHDPKTIQNIIQQQELISDRNLGITSDMSTAEKAIKYLQE